jgi:hypothetical protein
MLRKIYFLLPLTLLATIVCAQYKVKWLIRQPPAFGKYELKIIPIAYDSSVTDSNIINCIDTLPSYLFGVRTYNLLYKDDTNRLAITANEHGMFRKKFYITEYWKNGNMKRSVVYKRHSRHYLCCNYYENGILSSKGKYRNNKKMGRWIYTNTGKKKIRVEQYASDGTLKKTKKFKPPHATFATAFTVAHPEGKPYLIVK